jgi:hypothetical protein
MQRFVLWLCDPTIRGADVTETNLRANMPSRIEADWLWILLARSTDDRTHLARAQAVANLDVNQKQGLANWVGAVANVAQHFLQTPPNALPFTPPNAWSARGSEWGGFKTLLLGFYDPGLRQSLPYQSNGTPTINPDLQVSYQDFVREFRQAHRLDPHPDAREICVLCSGELCVPAVDHWVGKGAFPLLAVCADNLLPICVECNEAPNKGQKPVHNNGEFGQWFHPYLRHANGAILLSYDAAGFGIRVDCGVRGDEQRVQNMDQLLNLGERWTREFKAEFRKKQRELEQQIEKSRNAGLEIDGTAILAMLTNYRDSLSPSEPKYEVHRVVANTLLEPSRLRALIG